MLQKIYAVIYCCPFIATIYQKSIVIATTIFGIIDFKLAANREDVLKNV